MKRRKKKGKRRNKCVVERVRERERLLMRAEGGEVISLAGNLHFKVTEFVPWLQTCSEKAYFYIQKYIFYIYGMTDPNLGIIAVAFVVLLQCICCSPFNSI